MATPFPIDLSSLSSILFYVIFIVFIFYGQKIQFYSSMMSVKGEISKVQNYANSSKARLLKYLSGITQDDVSGRIAEFMEYRVIMPESLDPAGVVQKMKHVVRTRDDRIRTEIRDMVAAASPMQVSIAENELEISAALYELYKVLRHYYLMAKRTKSIYLMVQLQMVIPMLMEEVEALSAALEGLEKGQPIGDTAGPITVSKYMQAPSVDVAKDTVMSTVQLNSRTLYVVKAKGPEGYVGEPAEAVESLFSSLEKEGKKPKMIITVDAALKMEGEKSGEVAEAVGVAIGGLGIERFEIESVAAKYGVPIYAVLVKQSIKEAITTMTKEISDSLDTARKRVERLIERKSAPGDLVVLIGVGNTSGCGQPN